jgi:peroxiredoxin
MKTLLLNNFLILLFKRVFTRFKNEKELSLQASKYQKMNLKKSVIFLFLLPGFAFAQKSLKITGNVKGLKEASVVFMTDINHPSDTLGKAVVKKGAFVLNSTLKEPTLATLSLAPGKNIITFFDNSKMKINGDIAAVDKLKITGSSVNDDFNEFQKVFNPLFDRLVKTNQQMQFRGQTDSLVNASLKINDTIQQQIDVFIDKHKSSAVSAFLLTATYQLKDDVMLADARVNKLDSSALNNLYGDYLVQTIAENKPTAVGAMAMDFTQADTLGNPVSLSSFRGKYVLVDFWASWCGPCRMENPNVVANFNRFKEKNFTILGVSLDRPGQKEKWLEAIHADNLTWTHVSDLQFWNNAVAQQYGIQQIPQNLLIGPDGKIVAKNLRGPILQQKLCEVLGCN